MKTHLIFRSRLVFGKGRLLYSLSAVILLLGAALGHGQALPPVEITPGGPAYAPGEVLVQFKANVTDQQIAGAFQQARLGLIKHIQTPAMKDHGQIGFTRASTARPVLVAVRLLNNLPGVEYAEPNWVATQQAVPNDPFYNDGSLWGLYGDDLQNGVPSPIGPAGTTNPYGTQAEKAWAAGFIGSRDVYVGIIDSGVQVDHPDLAANIWTNPGEIPGNGIDDDGDGYVDDVHGWNGIEGDGNVDDLDSHGTHLAGTIGAVGGNGIGVVGVNWNVSLVAGRCFSGGWGYYSDIIEAIDYMTNLKTRKGLNIVALNNSYHGAFSQELADALTRAAQAGILCVAAAGNDALDDDTNAAYPACLDTTATAGYDAVIAVAAVSRAGGLASYSSYGQTTVDLGAPGGDRVDPNDPTLHDPDLEILSTVPPSTYGTRRGTSMATPHVTGAVALYASAHPGSTPAQIRHDLLTAGVRSLPALDGITVTGGTLDVGALMTVPVNSLPVPAAPANVRATVVSAARIDLSWEDQSGNELGFAIERSTDGQNYTLKTTVGANYVGYSDQTVQPGSTYYYRLRAYNPGGGSEYAYAPTSITVPTVTPPAAPSNLSATVFSGRKRQPGGVNLTWTDNADNEDGYQIERKTGNNGTWQFLATVGADTADLTDTSTSSRTTYTYRVRAFNVAGGSPYSNEVSVKTK